MSKVLEQKNFIRAAQILNVEVAVIKAVCEVEAPMGGFLPNDKPTILFEAHKFSKYTDHKYDQSHPHISSRKWNRNLYKWGEKEYIRLEEAKKLDKIAALKSASWGKFQIMGFNYSKCGYDNVEQFVRSMYISENTQLQAFIKFIISEDLIKPLRDHDWRKFARGYNGAGYEVNKYHIKLEKAYNKYKDDEPKSVNDIMETLKNIPIRPME